MSANVAYGQVNLHSEPVAGGVYEDLDKMVTLVRQEQESYELTEQPLNFADDVPAAGSQQTTPMYVCVDESSTTNSTEQQQQHSQAVADSEDDYTCMN